MKLELEQLVDRFGLAGVLFCLAEIAGEKALHIQENWQRERLSEAWNEAGVMVDRVAARVEV